MRGAWFIPRREARAALISSGSRHGARRVMEEGREAEELLEGYDGCGVGVLAAPLVNSS